MYIYKYSMYVDVWLHMQMPSYPLSDRPPDATKNYSQPYPILHIGAFVIVDVVVGGGGSGVVVGGGAVVVVVVVVAALVWVFASFVLFLFVLFGFVVAFLLCHMVGRKSAVVVCNAATEACKKNFTTSRDVLPLATTYITKEDM